MFLQRKDSLGCIFRLNPHIIGVEAVGVAINYNDEVKFESLAIQGQFLHSNSKSFEKYHVAANGDW